MKKILNLVKGTQRVNVTEAILLRFYANEKVFNLDSFGRRHNSQEGHENIREMLKEIKCESVEEMIAKIIPDNIYNKKGLNPEKVPKEGLSETEALAELRNIMKVNRVDIKSMLGQGFYGTETPKIILRNLLENPSWYTPYTPYQAEISQGRLESLLNFQTMVKDLTGMEVSNASMLDEATAAAEAMTMCFNLGTKNMNKFIVSNKVNPTTKALLRTRAEPVKIELVFVDDLNDINYEEEKDIAGVMIQYPDTTGGVQHYEELVKRVHGGASKKTKVVAVTDLMACTQLTPPGEFGCDIVVGSNQRFGVPMGYGGPNAGFLASRKAFQRKMPGRIIGSSVDRNGKIAYRMALQTREQHIKRDRATSNICTAQALLANVSAMYAVYHGPEGLKQIGQAVHKKAAAFAKAIGQIETVSILNDVFFDTVTFESYGVNADAFVAAALNEGYNIRKLNAKQVAVAFDETTQEKDIEALVRACQKVTGDTTSIQLTFDTNRIANSEFARKTAYLTHPVFNSYHTEHELLRYMYRLERKDIGLNTAMIPLGSCTMKLNATSEMIPVTWPEIGGIHPYAPVDQVEGYQTLFQQLEQWLCEITGFDAMSLQPNAGSQGEYAGLYSIKKYHESRGESQRDVCLIPISAHGTNPASASMCKMKVVPVKCDPATGNIDLEHLKSQAEKFSDRLAAVMITYPSTYGIYEEGVKQACEIVHQYGGQVYLDGANMNAQVAFTSPGYIGADVCHLNLHKTFCIPHGGGGPGMGPIGVKSHLAPFLPNHSVIDNVGGDQSMGQVSMAPWGSSSILPITWMYIRMLGIDGLKQATTMALLNANYMLSRLEKHYDIYYKGKQGYCAHEFIVKCSSFKKTTGIESGDIAKRLQDFGLHAPTQSFPIANTMMIEPTESESKEELDRYVDALIKIRQEIAQVESGNASKESNVVINSPHASYQITANDWEFPYTREEAAYPLAFVRERKYYPPVARIDEEYGDRNLYCECPPVEAFESL